jgi:hypothetical protein
LLTKINNGVADQKNAFADQKNNFADHFTNSLSKTSDFDSFINKFGWRKCVSPILA